MKTRDESKYEIANALEEMTPEERNLFAVEVLQALKGGNL